MMPFSRKTARCCEMLLWEVPTASTMSWTLTSCSPSTHRIFSRSGCEMAFIARAACSICSLRPISSKMSSCSRFTGFVSGAYYKILSRNILDHRIHVQDCPAAPRGVHLEPREPLHGMDRRRPVRSRSRGSPPRRPAAARRGLRVRCRLYLGAQARRAHALDRARRARPGVDPGAQVVAAERASLRNAARPEQGGDRGEIRREKSARMAPQLRYPARPTARVRARLRPEALAPLLPGRPGRARSGDAGGREPGESRLNPRGL